MTITSHTVTPIHEPRRLTGQQLVALEIVLADLSLYGSSAAPGNAYCVRSTPPSLG